MEVRRDSSGSGAAIWLTSHNEASSQSRRFERRKPTLRGYLLRLSSSIRAMCYETKVRPTPTSFVMLVFQPQVCGSTAPSMIS